MKKLSSVWIYVKNAKRKTKESILEFEESYIKNDILKSIEVLTHSSQTDISDNLFETHLRFLGTGLEFFREKRKEGLKSKGDYKEYLYNDLLESNYKVRECLIDCLSNLKDLVSKDRIHYSSVEDVNNLIETINSVVEESKND